MPIGTCDPASRGDAFNVTELSIDDGNVTITVRWGWDGISTKETGCTGPLVNGTGPASNRWAIQAVNNTNQDYYAHTIGKRGQPRSYKLSAGATQKVTAQQAAQVGYDTIDDIYELSMNTTP